MDWNALGREAVQLLSEYLRIDTTNPPGNEDRATAFLSRILSEEGIDCQVYESAPGRSNLYARLEGDGSKRAVVLLSHSDVVPADRRFWSVNPFGGVVRDGYIWGRGALDMKNLGIAELVVFLALHRNRFPLKRDVILLVTADEEAGGAAGARWITRNRPELVSDAEFLINESGKGRLENGRAVYSIDITEKSPCWIRLIARGEPGHGSRPKPHSAVNRLIRALHAIMQYTPPIKVTDAAACYFAGIAHLQKDGYRKRFERIRESVRDKGFLDDLLRNQHHAAMLRNTISITMLQGSEKINIIPQAATAELDCRLLPGERPEDFVRELKKVVDDDGIEIETTLNFGNSSSPFDSPLVDAVREVVSRYHGHVEVVPNMLSGFTDSHYFRDLGIHCYGFMPFLLVDEELRRIHGNDERISVENMERGPRILYEVIEKLCG